MSHRIAREGAADLPDQGAFERRIAFFHEVIAEWLADPATSIAAGRWEDGAVTELVPEGRARLLPAAYSGCFAGVREVRLEGVEHHVHLDLGRVHALSYAVAPSVCFASRPGFEVRLLLTGPGGAPTSRWGIALMLSDPYPGDGLDRDLLARYFERARRHQALSPELVRVDLACLLDGRPEVAAILECAGPTAWIDAQRAPAPPPEPAEPHVRPLLEAALGLRGATVVIYRDRTLVELKTERLSGLVRAVEGGLVTWQLGAFDDHHCHLALGAVVEVLFSAEPVPCQGGRLNYTVWFLARGACGNPFRPDGYFSITLDAPYDGDRPRADQIGAVFDLYRRFRHESWVRADETFLIALRDGPPARRFPAPAV